MASERIEKLLAMQQKAEAQKRKAEQQLKAAKHKISIQRNKERTHRLCERGGHLEHYLPNPELLTDEDVFLLIDYFFFLSPCARAGRADDRQPTRGASSEPEGADRRSCAAYAETNHAKHGLERRKRGRRGERRKQPHPVRAHLYASSMRRAFSEGPCGALDAFGINRGKPLRRLHRLPHDGALRRETEVNPCPARRGALRSSAAEKVNPVWLPARITLAKRSIPNTSAAGNIRTAARHA